MANHMGYEYDDDYQCRIGGPLAVAAAVVAVVGYAGYDHYKHREQLPTKQASIATVRSEYVRAYREASPVARFKLAYVDGFDDSFEFDTGKYHIKSDKDQTRTVNFPPKCNVYDMDFYKLVENAGYIIRSAHPNRLIVSTRNRAIGDLAFNGVTSSSIHAIAPADQHTRDVLKTYQCVQAPVSPEVITEDAPQAPY